MFGVPGFEFKGKYQESVFFPIFMKLKIKGYYP